MIAATATLRGTVAAAQLPATLTGSIPGASATLTGTVSTALVTAFRGPTTATGLRLKIDGHWVPDEDLIGSITTTRSIDTWRATARVTLAARRWQIPRTMATWTLTPAEVWRRQRAADGAIIERLELRGHVLPGGAQTDGAATEVTITIADDAPYLDLASCVEVEPFSGQTRGSLFEQIAADAGITSTSVAGGARFDKPLFTDGRPVLEFLKAFGDPEGWSQRFIPNDEGGLDLESYVPELAQAPDPPTDVWRIGDLETIAIGSPTNAPSTVTVRGLGPVVVEEDGIRVETTVTEVRSPYAPIPAVARQAADGSQTPASFATQVADRVVRRIELEQRYRGDDLVEAVTREFGWYNPRAPRLRAGTDRAGPVDGYYYVAGSYITADGKYVRWSAERFVQISERRVANAYDGARNLTGTTTEEDRWHGRTQAVENTDGGLVVGAVIGDDDQSYESPLDRYGRALRHEVSFVYDSASGAATTERQDTYAYYSPRAALDVNGHFLRYDGEARIHSIDPWMLTQSQHVIKILTSDNLEAGSVRVRSGFRVASRLGGQFDYGGSTFSDQASEVFRPVETESRQLNRRSDGTVEEIVFQDDGPPTSRIIPGGLPVPRFQSSPWTRIVQEPIEVLLEDDVLRQLFGGREVTLSSDFLTSVDEALAWAERIIRRQTSLPVQVTRPLVPCKPGDTILIVSPDDGLNHRALVVDCQTTDVLEDGSSTGSYRLEVPIL